jgi:hypothetical protein
MAAVTKYILAEQALYIIAGGFPDTSEAVQLVDMYPAIEQIVNTLLKTQQFSVNMPNGETIPENLLIGIYEDIAVTGLGYDILKSKATLPIQPIGLPKNMGVYQIYDARYPDSPFIPIQAGQTALLRTDVLLSDFLGQVSYEVKGRTIFFNRNLPLYGVNTVTIELIVMDISLYNETDTLPIPADMQGLVVQQLVQRFSPVVPETGNVNPFSNIANQPEKAVGQR